MKTRISFCTFLISIAAPFCLSAQSFDVGVIEQIIGVKGVMNTNENVFKITVPRTDVKVSVDGWPMPPFMGLGTWAAFSGGANRVMVMGDTVLLQDEVNPVMSAALDNGLAVTALHNHFFFDEPKVYFMHIEGHSDSGPEQLAVAVKKVWDKVKEVRGGTSSSTGFSTNPIPTKSSITLKTIEDGLGVKGQTNSGMVKIVIGRPTKMSGTDVTKDMGASTWAAFAGMDDNAVVDGDFAVHEDELQGVLKALRQGGINIVAIHSHMAGETPRTLFLHFWGRGAVADLVKTLKAAVDTQGKGTGAAMKSM